MSTPSNAEKLSRGEDVGVDVAAIEREFATLWREAGGEQDGSIKPVTRACLANLMVLVEREELMAPLKAAFDALVLTVPARVLVLQVEDAAAGKAEFESFISANCILSPGGGKLVCSEEVTLVARGEGLSHLGSVVRALLVPNVPSMCLLPFPPDRAAKPLAGLLPLADRVLLDSCTMRDPSLWTSLAATIQRARQVVDLGWLGLTSMRSSLASVFDHEAPRHVLQTLQRVTLRSPAGRLANQVLILGWLADRLAWRNPRALPDGTVTVEMGRMCVTLDVQAVHTLPDGVEPAMELILSGEPGQVRLTRGAAPVLTVESLDRPAQHIALDPSTLGERIARGMGPKSVDPLFLKAMARVVELVGLLPRERVG